MKVISTFDILAQKRRIEPTKTDKYAVRLEDYESLNDLVMRSVLTKTSLNSNIKELHVDGAQYDTDKEIENSLSELYSSFAEPAHNEAGDATENAEQSESPSDAETAEELQAKQ